MGTENTATTVKAREKFAKAHKGDITFPTVAQIAFGNGGHDAGGQPITPTGNELVVPGEFLKKAVSGLSHPVNTTLRIEGNLDFTEGNGQQVSAAGIYDSDGDLVAVKTFTPKAKDEDTRIEVQWDEQF